MDDEGTAGASRAKARGMDIATVNYWLRIAAIAIDLMSSGILIYFAFLGLPLERGKLIGVVIGIIIGTASLVYMVLHPLEPADRTVSKHIAN